jgi:subtilisin family serine protease
MPRVVQVAVLVAVVASGMAATPTVGRTTTTAAAATPTAVDGVALVRLAGRRDGARLVGRHGVTRVEPIAGSEYVKVAAPGRASRTLVDALQRDDAVLAAEPELVYRATQLPDDPFVPQQQWFFDRIDADAAWGLGDASAVPVAVVDSGVDLDHPDLVGKLLPGTDLVDGDSTPNDVFGHGTAVAGVVGATTGNGIGVASAGVKAPIIPVKVLDANGETTTSVLVQGINWAVSHGAKVVNLSVGGPAGTNALRSAVQSAVASGVVVVASAGNAAGATPEYPAAYAEAISVGSTDMQDGISSFSNRGADLVAPGEDIVTTGNDPNDQSASPYVSATGTSFSAPLVAGIAARMLAVTPGRTPAGIQADLSSTAFDLGPPGTDATFGAGLLDAGVALAAARAGTSDTGTDTATEPNQLPSQAAQPSALPLAAAIGSPGDVDWYRIAPSSGQWRVTVTPTGASGQGIDPVVTVFDADETQLVEADAAGQGAAEHAGVAVPNPAPSYLVRVANALATTGGYSLSLTGGPSQATADGTHPSVTSSSIADRSTGVATDVTFVLTAPVPLDATSVTPDSVKAVAASGGATRATTVSVDGTRTRVTATFTSLPPTQDLVLTTRRWLTDIGAELRDADPVRFRTGTATSPPPTDPTTTTTTTTTPAPAPAPTAPPPGTTVPPRPPRAGYWMVGTTGDVFAFGDAPYRGGAPVPANARATNIAATPSGNGYWVVTDVGGVYAFGDAPYAGGSPPLATGEAVTSISATPDGGGYWLFTNLGRAFAYGTATHLGDMAGTRLNGGVLGSVATPSGRGYYMVAADGGIFSFGDAVFHGSMGGARLNGPVVGLAPDPDGGGYWLVATDGGIFTFDATFRGSMGAVRLNRPMIGMVAYGDGYLMVASDGGIFDFSSKPFVGSLGDHPPAHPIVAVAPVPD